MPLDSGISEFYELMNAHCATTNVFLKSVGAPLMTEDELQDNCNVCQNYGYVVPLKDHNQNIYYVCSTCYAKPR